MLHPFYRYKGIIAVKGFDEKFVFQGVHMLFDGDFMGQWKEGEKRESKFVFIGKGLDREELTEGFRKCTETFSIIPGMSSARVNTTTGIADAA